MSVDRDLPFLGTSVCWSGMALFLCSSGKTLQFAWSIDASALCWKDSFILKAFMCCFIAFS